MSEIKAIETVYKGFRFRSRLEARYAVFFDVMGEKWEYEKEGYNLNGINYLPDFYLPKFKLHIEIKGQEPTEKELHKCSLFQDHTGQAIAIFHGLPTENKGKVYLWDLKESGSAGSSDWEIEFCDNDHGILNFSVDYDPSNRGLYADMNFMHELKFAAGYAYIGKTQEAAILAKQARFEHGESPKLEMDAPETFNIKRVPRKEQSSELYKWMQENKKPHSRPSILEQTKLSRLDEIPKRNPYSFKKDEEE